MRIDICEGSTQISRIMLHLVLLALVAGMTVGQSDFNMGEYCSLTPDGSRGLRYNSSDPFVVTAVTKSDNHCYYGGRTLEVIVAVNDIRTEKYTDFMLQANAGWMKSVGSFSAHDEFPDVETASCNNGKDNVIMNGESGVYYAHRVYWTAPKDMYEDILFKATFLDSKRGIYWNKLAMFPLKYNNMCEPDAPYPSAANIPTGASLAAILLAAIVNVHLIM